jgi:photosystem II stability/assembly factor-like uncharacterized protein
LIALFSSAQSQALNWTIISRDLATIIGGVSFVTENTGWVSGAANGLGPVIFYTSDGGATWTNQNTAEDSLAFLAIAVEPTSLNGICSGLGIIGLASGSAFTTNGQNWTVSKTSTYVAAFQSVGVASTGDTWQVGTWAPDGNGMLVSTDSGATDSRINWPLVAEARYGSFPDDNLQTAFIAGGDFPDTNLDIPDNYHLHRFNHKIAFVISKNGKDVQMISSKYLKAAKKNKDEAAARPPPPPPPPTIQWAAAAAKTSDGGQTWTTLINQTWYDPAYGYYFNQISFVDDNNGWIVGQGQYADGSSFGQVIYTSNGGQNWTTQLNITNAEFTAIQMVNATTGWAAGGIYPPKGAFEATFWFTNDGGNTWTATGGTIKDFATLSISVVGNVVYAVGAAEAGYSSVAKFSF